MTSTRKRAADQQRELAEVHFRDQHLVVAAVRPRPVFAGNGLRWRRCACATWPALASGRARRGTDRPVGRTPAEHQHARLAVGVVDLQRRDVSRDAVDLRLAGAHHEVVVGRVVGDVAVTVLPSRCRRCGARGPACPGSPRSGESLAGRAGRARTRRCRRRAGGWARSRSPREVGQVVDGRASATARSRWRGSRRRAA